MVGAGYDVATDSEYDKDSALAIWFEDEFETAKALDIAVGKNIIRLRDYPEAPKDSSTIYRYDREGLIAALQAARSSGAAR